MSGNRDVRGHVLSALDNRAHDQRTQYDEIAALRADLAAARELLQAIADGVCVNALLRARCAVLLGGER